MFLDGRIKSYYKGISSPNYSDHNSTLRLYTHKLDVVTHTFNPGAQKAEAG